MVWGLGFTSGCHQDATYAVMWHEGWGNVKGETFDDFSRACARFDALEGGRYAAILVDGRFRELRYYGTRGGLIYKIRS